MNCDTTMSRIRNIEREVGFKQIFVKFEGGNPITNDSYVVIFTGKK